MQDKTKHQRALDLIAANRMPEAVKLLDLALAEKETSELWNDWATVKIVGDEVAEARRGYERAVELNPENARAQFNLALILVAQGELRRGLALLRTFSARLGKDEQAAVASLLEQHKEHVDSAGGGEKTPAEKTTGRRVLLVHEALPHFDRSGADMRLMQVLRRLRAQGHEVTYIARHAGERGQYEPVLKELGIAVFAGDAERLRALGMDIETQWKLEDVLRAGRFDAAIFFHWFWSGISVTEQYLDDVRRFSPSTRLIVLTDDRHGIREWRASQLSGLLCDGERALDFLEREFECYRAADLVLAISHDDRQGMLELAPELQIELLPMTAEINARAPGPDSRRDFVFLANYDNLANRDAIAWLCEEIWPRIRKRLPEANLHLVGNNIPADLTSTEGVRVLGYVADLEEALKEFRVFLSPIRFGTGIKTKNLMALSQGIPLVTTTIGAEGMALTDGENVLIADSTGPFCNKAIDLYKDSDLWLRLSGRGRRHIETEFSVQRQDARISEIMKKAEGIVPQPFDPEHRFSFNLAEEFRPQALTAQPPDSRYVLRALAYLELAERLLEMEKPSEARRQLRHIFSYVRGQVPRTPFFARVFSMLERCYRELGESESSARCGQEARLCLPELNPALRREATKSKSVRAAGSAPAISVIVPTFNRRAKLERCLRALTLQSLSAQDFEVIVADDGSTDDTQSFLQSLRTPFRLHCLRQNNQGAGAARRMGVERARGEYLLLINDDTIAHIDLLREHLFKHRTGGEKNLAVLGTFEYESGARERALMWFLSTDPFMFPQLRMKAGTTYSAPHFVTCNLSIARDAVLKCGSFDSSFRLGEDSELGLRLAKAGTNIVYHPAARAWHDHLDMTMADMIGRARAYGSVYLQLLRKHPHLEVPTLFGTLRSGLTVADIEQFRTILAARRSEVEESVKALEQYDSIDFRKYFDMPAKQGSAADMIAVLFSRAVPQVYWFYLVETFCSLWSGQSAPTPATELSSAGARR